MRDFHLALCEATFLERHTGVHQLMLVKNGTRLRLLNEPWTAEASASMPAARQSAV